MNAMKCSLPAGPSSRGWYPFPGNARGESVAWVVLAMATTVAVLQFFSAMAVLAARGPAIAARLNEGRSGIPPALFASPAGAPGSAPSTDPTNRTAGMPPRVATPAG